MLEHLPFLGGSLLKIHNQPQLPVSRADAISQLVIMDGPADLVDNGHSDINDGISYIHIFPRATEETKSKYVHWSQGYKL
jgi:hypothetical protein